MTVVRALRGGWLVLVLTAAAGLAGAVVAWQQQTPVYRSSLQLLVAVPGATTPDDDTRNRSTAVARAFGLAQLVVTPPALADAQAVAGTRSAAAVAVGAADLSDPFLRVEVTDPDPGTARAVAAAFATSLPRTAARLGVDSRGVALVVLDPASPPVVAAPLTWRFLLTGLAAGLATGLALVLLREIRHPTPADAEEIAAVIGRPLLAVVPEAARGAPVVAGPRDPRAEAYRQVLTAAVHASPRGIRTVAVVGVGPDDGATSLRANLLELATAAGHVAVEVPATATAEQVREVRAHGGQDLLLVDAGRLLPRPGRAGLLTAADGVVVTVAWRHRDRVPAAARTLRRLDVTVVGLVVHRGPRAGRPHAWTGAAVTTTVPVRRDHEPLPRESLPSEMHA